MAAICIPIFQKEVPKKLGTGQNININEPKEVRSATTDLPVRNYLDFLHAICK